MTNAYPASEAAPQHTGPSLPTAGLAALHPYRALPDPLGAAFPDTGFLSALAAARDLRNGQGLPLSFTSLPAMLKAADYESGIWRTGAIPVQLSTLHDRLNALAWLAFPRLKAALNAAHARALLANPKEARWRGRRRDALTLLDEMGMLVTGPADLLHALAAREWRGLFVQQRERVITEMSFTAVGHGLLEKAMTPYPALTAKCLLIEAPRPLPWSALDEAAAAALADIDVPAALPPLPICGIPGWWEDNRRADFYDDRFIFRPPRDA